MNHTIKTKDGGARTITNYTRSLAIKLHCTACMGYEGDPKDCTSPKCALYPYRKKTLAAHHADARNSAPSASVAPKKRFSGADPCQARPPLSKIL